MLRSVLIGTLALTAVLFIGCLGNSDDQGSKAISTPNIMGRDIVVNNCIACHDPKAGMDNRIAPPLIAIKKHYIDSRTTEEEFAKDLITFMNEPSEENSKMPGAVKKFGLMPKQLYSDDQLRDIADYLFNTDIEEPDWFKEHYEEEHGKGRMRRGRVSEGDLDHKALGQKYAMNTKAVLGKNLMGQINAHGTERALEFCNEKAILLTDSMAKELDVKIKRVSDKPRNSNNRADEFESAYISMTKETLLKGEKIEPATVEIGDRVFGYYPIETNKMCLQCHGNVENDISDKTLASIKEYYPEDKAIGYGENELRGIWVVEMNK